MSFFLQLPERELISDLRNLEASAASRRNPFTQEAAPLDQAALHFVPTRNLFDRAWGYEKDEVVSRLRKVRAFGYPKPFDFKYNLDGAYSGSKYRHVAFLRDGSLEFQMSDIVRNETAYKPPRPIIGSWEIAEAVQGAFDDAMILAEEGHLFPPLLVRLHLMQIKGAEWLRTPRFGSLVDKPLAVGELSSKEVLLLDWNTGPTIMRDMLDGLWQAWGYPSCPTLDEMGRHVNPTATR